TTVAETELGERAKTEAVDSVAKDEGVIVGEEDHDVLHFDKSSDLPLSTSLNDLDNVTLHINGQSAKVDAPPDIIDLDEDDDISDDEDVICHDLADSDDEDLMSADVARGHDGDDGGDDRPPTHHIPTGYGGCFANRDINAGIHQHLQKLYNTNKASLKAAHWVINPETGTYDMESIRQRRPENITLADWDAQLAFWNDLRNQARAAQNRQNRAKSTVVCQQGSRSLARLRDQMDEMLRLQRLGSNTERGAPYTKEEIMAIVQKGKQRGHFLGVGRVLSGRATGGCPPPPQSTVDPFESSPEFGGPSGSGGCEDDEPDGDEDDDDDAEDEKDDDS
nr:hypothetical protein [Tanacetum cinerariifolium]